MGSGAEPSPPTRLGSPSRILSLARLTGVGIRREATRHAWPPPPNAGERENDGEATTSDLAALDEFRQRIAERYPEATFVVERGIEPLGVYLVATVDVEDTGVVSDLIADRMLSLQIDEGLPLYVTVVRPLARVVAEIERRNDERSAPLPGAG